METTRFREALEALVSGEKSPADALGIPRRVLDGMYTLGCDALARDRAKDAEALFLRCVQLDPSRSEFWLALASARKATGEVEAAGELYQFAAMFGEKPNRPARREVMEDLFWTLLNATEFSWNH